MQCTSTAVWSPAWSPAWSPCVVQTADRYSVIVGRQESSSSAPPLLSVVIAQETRPGLSSADRDHRASGATSISNDCGHQDSSIRTNSIRSHSINSVQQRSLIDPLSMHCSARSHPSHSQSLRRFIPLPAKSLSLRQFTLSRFITRPHSLGRSTRSDTGDSEEDNTYGVYQMDWWTTRIPRGLEDNSQHGYCVDWWTARIPRGCDNTGLG